MNQLYSDQNQVFAAAASYETTGTFAGFDGAASVLGGNAPDGDNTAYAVAGSGGKFINAFGIEYSGATLWGYSPDPNFVQSTPTNNTLDGNDSKSWTMLGGAGNDSIDGGSQGDYIVGDRGPDINAPGNSRTPNFGLGNDTIVGNDGNNTIFGDFVGASTLGGNDSITAGIGNDSIEAGGGNDTVAASDGDDTVSGADGNDSITAGLGNDSLLGNGGADTIDSGDGDNYISGGVNFSIAPFPGQDDAADSLISGSGNDTIYGGLGNDTIQTGNGLNEAYGQDGNDSIIGGDSVSGNSDTILGGDGNDTINGNGGNDSLLGEKGDDLFLFADSAAFIAATLNGGDDTDTATLTGDAQTLVAADFANASNIEILRTANGANSITLGEKAATLTGLDSVIGGTGSDTLVLAQDFTTAVSLYGGNGNDSVGVDNYGQVTLGYLDGGAGTDTLSINDSIGSSLSPSVISDANVVNFEALYLGSSADNYAFIGSATGPVTWGIASVFGGAGVQNFINASNVTTPVNLFGDTLGDALTAGSGNDYLQGWSGSPTANKSSDTLTGGSGVDTLIAGNVDGNAYGSAKSATLFAVGFEAGAGADQIQVNGDKNTYSLETLVGGSSYIIGNLKLGTDVIGSLQINTLGYTTEADFITNNVIGTTV